MGKCSEEASGLRVLTGGGSGRYGVTRGDAEGH